MKHHLKAIIYTLGFSLFGPLLCLLVLAMIYSHTLETSRYEDFV